MSSFPTNARTGQTHKKFGRKYAYSETTGTWAPVVPLASVAEVRKAETTATSATQFYALATDLPLSGNTAGSMAFVQETNRLYLWSGTGWYNVATISGAAASVSGANTSYEFATDGTPIVITLSQTGLTSPTWSYQVTTGSLGRTATITQADNVFTITPSTNENDVNSFSITFTATDGSNTLVTTSEFTLPFFGPNWANTTLVHTLNDPNAYGNAAGDNFGYAVSIDGNYGIFSSYGEHSATGTSSGNAFLYNVVTGQKLHNLINPSPGNDAGGDRFGVSVDISGNYAIVGSFLEDNASGDDGGKAYIYNVTTGALVYTLDNPDSFPSTGDRFGVSVAISGNYIIVGSREDDGYPTGADSGRAYVYRTTTGDWSDTTLVHTLLNPNPTGASTNDFFASSVSISGNYAICSAYGEDTGAAATGSAYIFNVVTGALVYTIDNPNAYDTASLDQMGYTPFFNRSVSMNGNYVIIGAPQEDDAGGTSSGKAYIFKTTTGDWSDTTLVQTLDNPNAYDTSLDDLFGHTVAINGNYAAVGALQEDDANGVQSGKVYVFDITTGSLLKTLDNPNPYGTSDNDRFGWAISLSGEYLAVGAYLEDDSLADQGKVYIFQAG